MPRKQGFQVFKSCPWNSKQPERNGSPQTAISYVKDFNCHIGTAIGFWLFGGSRPVKRRSLKSDDRLTSRASKMSRCFFAFERVPARWTSRTNSSSMASRTNSSWGGAEHIASSHHFGSFRGPIHRCPGTTSQARHSFIDVGRRS